MAAVKGEGLNVMLCEALNLDPEKVSKITIVATVDDAVRVTVEMLMPGDEADDVVSIVKSYTLVDDDDAQ